MVEVRPGEEPSRFQKGEKERSMGTAMRLRNGGWSVVALAALIATATALWRTPAVSGVVPAGEAEPADATYVDALWAAHGGGLLKIDHDQGAVLLEIATETVVTVVEVDGERGLVWAAGGGLLRSFTFGGEPVFQVSLPSGEEDEEEEEEEEDGPKAVALAVNGRSGTVWLGMKRALLQFDSQARLVHTIPLPEKLVALDVDPAESLLWAATRTVLAAFDENANPVRAIELGKTSSVEDITVDPASGEIWVAEKERLLRLDAAGSLQMQVAVKGIRGLVADGQGGVWLTTGKDLQHLDFLGRILLDVKPLQGKAGKLSAPVVHALDGSVWVAASRRAVRISPQGEVVGGFELQDEEEEEDESTQQGRLQSLALYVDVIPPELSLETPLQDSFLSDQTPEMQVRFSDVGRGVEPSTLRWESAGKSFEADCSFFQGGATCIPVVLFSEGTVELTATVSDFNGNRSAQAARSFTVDVTPAAITLHAPAQGLLTNQPLQTVSGEVSEPVVLTVNGRETEVDEALRFATTVVLEEGTSLIQVRAVDRSANESSRIIAVTLDTTAPAPADIGLIRVSRPAEGRVRVSGDAESVEAEATVGIRHTGSGAVATAVADDKGSFQAEIAAAEGDRLALVVTDSAGNASKPVEILVMTGAQPPVLDPIGDQIVALGTTLTLQLSAFNPTGSPLLFGASPLPLPDNARLDAVSGLFEFTPRAGQAGTFRLTFSARAGGLGDAETVALTVTGPDASGVTSLSGRLLDAADFERGVVTPVVGATVSLLGSTSSVLSDAEGAFTVRDIPDAAGVLEIDPSTARPAPDGSQYAGFREELEPIAGVANVMQRPFFLPRIDAGSLTAVQPASMTTVTNPDLGVAFSVPSHTAKDDQGNDFTGALSISAVPAELAPVSLPDFLQPGLLVTIQPPGVSFANPVPITFPNLDGLAPGSEVDLWSLDGEQGVFSVVGKGMVSADQSRIETISGGIRATGWHGVLPQPPQIGGQVGGAQSPVQKDPRAANCECTSRVGIQNGSIEVDFSLPSHRSLGVSRALRFVYNTAWAHPRPVVSFDSTIFRQQPLPRQISYRISVGGVDQGGETFVDTSRLSETTDERLRGAVAFDAADFPTGVYPFTLEVTGHYLQSRVSGALEGRAQLRNESESPLGAGWTLEGVERIFANGDGTLSLISAEGAQILFNARETSAPFVHFSAEAGDFSTLVKQSDGGYVRTLKDGTRVLFDAQGLHTSTIDRNGNTTGYQYDSAGRLISITDPAGLTTTFAYQGNVLNWVTDPAGRTSSFSHDGRGNLIEVVFPDGHSRTFDYGERHLMISETDENGRSVHRRFDDFSRFADGTRRDGTQVGAESLQGMGLVDPASGLGTSETPAAPLRPDEALGSLTDASGNTTRFQTDRFGAVTRQIDAVGQLTRIDRDEDGNPIRITRPNGAVVTMSYDQRGNLLSTTDPLGASTTFTYDPDFNQVTSITDAKGHTTTLRYDGRGNPVEIIDALGNATRMEYDSRGLLTAVTAGVGTAEENTTMFGYDAHGNLTSTTDPLGNPTLLEYDVAGNVIRSTDAENRVTEFAYDPMNRLVSVLDAQANTTDYDYDPQGNLIRLTDARGQSTLFEYDEMDRVVSVTNPLGLVESFTYDATGNLASTTNRNGQILSFDYDVLNRLIRKTLPPSSGQAGEQVTSFDYDVVGNLTRVTNPATTISMQYDLADRLISSVSSEEAALGDSVQVIVENTRIDENNRDFEGKTLQVNGATLTVDGTHSFANLILINGAVLTHSPATATDLHQLELEISGSLQVDATSRIDASGRGFLGANQPGNPNTGKGMTLGFVPGSTGDSGGSYAGLGGAKSGLTNPVYGDFLDPKEPGSGGASSTISFRGGSGGGVVRIAAHTLLLQGEIRADGGGSSASCCAGGGSGGAVRIDAATLSGGGRISAVGGNGADGSGGGGGGRIAVFYQNAIGFDFSNLSASGGAGNAAPNGGAGTIYLQGPGREAGELIVDNNGLFTEITRTTPVAAGDSGRIELSSLGVLGQARARVHGLLNIAGRLQVDSDGLLALTGDTVASEVEVKNGAVLTQVFSNATEFFEVDLNVDVLTIDATSRIDVTARGFLGANLPRNPLVGKGMTLGFAPGSTGDSGGSYGGLGGVKSGLANPVYGDFLDPDQPGSGGGSSTISFRGGSGGGVVRIAARTLLLQGEIRADGGGSSASCCAGGGSGGAVRIDAATLSGGGRISAVGGNGADRSGGGGGGRIAVFYQDATGFDFSNLSAFGGTGNAAPNGGAGTIYLQGPGREAGELILDNQGIVAPPDSTPVLNAPAGLLSFTDLRLKRGAKANVGAELQVFQEIDISADSKLSATGRVSAAAVRITSRSSFDSAVDITANTVEVTDESVLGQLPTTGSELRNLQLEVDSLTVDATSRIDVTGRGFLGANQPGNPNTGKGMTLGFEPGSTGDSGGSYGGLGGMQSGIANPLYGDFQDPKEPGSGGGSSTLSFRGGSGGGVVRIAARTLLLQGEIRADGSSSSASCCAGGGSGGSVRIDAATLSGGGRISAVGGNGADRSGGGGGGRIALFFEDASGFDLAAVTAEGGAGRSAPDGEAGTVFLQQQPFIAAVPLAQTARVQARLPANESPAPTRSAPIGSGPQAPADVYAAPHPAGYPAEYARKAAQMETSRIAQGGRIIDRHTTADPASGAFIGTRFEVRLPRINRQAAADPVSGAESAAASARRREAHLPRTAERAGKPVNRYTTMAAQTSQAVDLDPVYSYDVNGNRISMIDPTGVTLYRYDELNRLISITNPSGLTTTFGYDSLGRRTSLEHANGVATRYSYDQASRLLDLTHQLGAATINSFRYSYDQTGNRTTRTDRNGTALYSYDDVSRLIQAVNPLPANPLESFTYDAVGNRVDSNQNGASTFNEANQLVADANFRYQYDANGNQIGKVNRITGLQTLFDYDAENQLIGITREDGSRVSYRYDGLGRRIEKNVAGEITRYLYDNEDILLELDAENRIRARYTHGPGIDEPLIMERDLDSNGILQAAEPFFYHADGLGSITELTDTTGALAQSYTYSSFGKIESQHNPALIQPYTFTAREFDAETGFFFYRARYYDPVPGRFLSEDPIISVFESGGANLYPYVRNNPSNFIDPSGEGLISFAACLGLDVGINAIALGIQLANLSDQVVEVRAKRRALEDLFCDTNTILSSGGKELEESNVRIEELRAKEIRLIETRTKLIDQTLTIGTITAIPCILVGLLSPL